MSKWKCDICNSEFNNYHAEGFNNKIYCPLCYYKHEYNDLQQQLQAYKNKENKMKHYVHTLFFENHFEKEEQFKKCKKEILQILN